MLGNPASTSSVWGHHARIRRSRAHPIDIPSNISIRRRDYAATPPQMLGGPRCDMDGGQYQAGTARRQHGRGKPTAHAKVWRCLMSDCSRFTAHVMPLPLRRRRLRPSTSPAYPSSPPRSQTIQNTSQRTHRVHWNVEGGLLSGIGCGAAGPRGPIGARPMLDPGRFRGSRSLLEGVCAG
ncbi:hypothetical protein CC85DRAFT_89731 [Cutaneotrichosporon oleaginosum]|uniref:Uncharacterized protein n=1 Tax=Cutaneotrichosporon oleaginosum TaxID=879819 RepID=A0A0J0XY27_9TREE|nr:uncharacterized protein CC85DRAFT_89731 [Cutaneotrichosporon oleaginosum]KLT45945.1 hypothetical protein CC85DRAFT_89731 [Cutaneotrichosporon oleaginosum]TXT06641.1 hypothetical protein COLE_05972 [Cutaneotrichosporon oleaginosum]